MATPSRRSLSFIAACALVLPVAAEAAERNVPVSLQPDGKMLTFRDSISEYDAISYAVPLQKGQALQVTLASSNAASCFDIHAPGEAKPFFVGADSGNSHRLHVPSSGTYVIRVFLLRFAARDGHSAEYALELTLEP